MTQQRTPYAPYGSATYRRELRARLSPGLAVGELIDDFHHFRAFVHHDGERITDIRAETPRYPWTTCPAAGEVLRELVGAPLCDSVRGPAAHTPARSQCTHLFDAACIAIARAGRAAGDVTYRVAFPDRVEGRSTATFERDGAPLLEWTLRGFEIESPEPYAGRSILRGFADWVADSFDPEHAEALWLFQRACVIAGGRQIDIEAVARADLGRHVPMGVCHTYQPGRADQAFRMLGSVRNLSDEPDLEAASLLPARRS
jgi:hypothetical protein